MSGLIHQSGRSEKSTLSRSAATNSETWLQVRSYPTTGGGDETVSRARFAAQMTLPYPASQAHCPARTSPTTQPALQEFHVDGDALVRRVSPTSTQTKSPSGEQVKTITIPDMVNWWWWSKQVLEREPTADHGSPSQRMRKIQIYPLPLQKSPNDYLPLVDENISLFQQLFRRDPRLYRVTVTLRNDHAWRSPSRCQTQ